MCAHDAGRFGAHMPLLPAGAALTDHRQGVVGALGDPLRVHGDGFPYGPVIVGGASDHFRECAFVSEDFDRFGAPGGALFCQGAWFVFGFAGFEVGALVEFAGFGGCGFAAEFALELGSELSAAQVDHPGAGGPAGGQIGVDADDFADRAFAGVGAGAFGEVDAETLSEVSLEAGVVGLGDRDHRFVQWPTVDGEPLVLPFDFHLVRDRDVGVQVGLARAGVAVGEGGGEHSFGVDLLHTVGAEPSEQGVALEPVERVFDRVVVRGFDRFGHLSRGQRPQGTDRLHRGEGDVVSGDGGGLGTRVLGDPAAEFAVVERCAAEFGLEHLAGDSGADLRADIVVDRRVGGQTEGGVVFGERFADRLAELGDAGVNPKRVAQLALSQRERGGVFLAGTVGNQSGGAPAFDGGGVGVFAFAEQREHVRFGDLVARADGAQRGQPRSHPEAGRLALRGVVVRESVASTCGGVVRSDLPDQVHVPVPGGQLVHRRGHETHHSCCYLFVILNARGL